MIPTFPRKKRSVKLQKLYALRKEANQDNF